MESKLSLSDDGLSVSGLKLSEMQTYLYSNNSNMKHMLQVAASEQVVSKNMQEMKEINLTTQSTTTKDYIR